MYGLVNQALEDMVVSRFGAEKWVEIKAGAQVNIPAFISMEPYPDEITYKLVGEACRVLGLGGEEILEEFGKYWILFTGREGYGSFLESGGNDLPTFIQNLDDLHSRVGLLFPGLKPPSFKSTDVCEDSLRLHYYSSRAGLAPFVVGLLKGLGELFNTDTKVLLETSREQGADHDQFFITFKARDLNHASTRLQSSG